MSFPANGKIYSHCLHINSKYANIHYVAENLFIRDFATTHWFHSGEQCRHRIKCELLHSVGAQLPGITTAEKEKNMSTMRESERNIANLHLINFSVALLFMHTNTTASRWFFSLCVMVFQRHDTVRNSDLSFRLTRSRAFVRCRIPIRRVCSLF